MVALLFVAFVGVVGARGGAVVGGHAAVATSVFDVTVAVVARVAVFRLRVAVVVVVVDYVVLPVVVAADVVCGCGPLCVLFVPGRRSDRPYIRLSDYGRWLRNTPPLLSASYKKYAFRPSAVQRLPNGLPLPAGSAGEGQIFGI